MTYEVRSADELDDATKRAAMARHRRGLLEVCAADAPDVGLTLLKVIEDCDAPDASAIADIRKVLEARRDKPDSVTKQAVYDALNKMEG